MTILNDFLYYYENGSRDISKWAQQMIPPLLISYCPTYEVPKNHNESSSSFFLGCNYLRTAVCSTDSTRIFDSKIRFAHINFTSFSAPKSEKKKERKENSKNGGLLIIR